MKNFWLKWTQQKLKSKFKRKEKTNEQSNQNG